MEAWRRYKQLVQARHSLAKALASLPVAEASQCRAELEALLKARQCNPKTFIEPGYFPQQDAIVDAVYNRVVHKEGAKVIAVMGGNRALRDDQLVLTTKGFKPIGEVTTADVAVTPEGLKSPIEYVDHRGCQPCYELVFNDGTKSICSDDHLWEVYTSRARFSYQSNGYKNTILGTTQLFTTKQLSDRFGSNPVPKQRWSLPIAEAFERVAMKYEITPYQMGVLLGDGCFRLPHNMLLTTADEEIVAEMPLAVKYGSKYDYHFQNRLWIDETKRLGLWGKYSYEKHIPREYIEGSIEQRKELIKGLMDTDGSCGKEGKATFYTTSPQLALDFCEVLGSLGSSYTINKKKSSIAGVRHRDHYAIYLRTSWCPFNLVRKAERWIKPVKTRHNKVIHSIKAIEQAPCTCIKLADPKGLFITNDFIVTHNSSKSVSGALGLLKVLEARPSTRAWAATFADLSVKNQQRIIYEWIDKRCLSYGTYNPQSGWIKRTIVLGNNSILGYKTYDQGKSSFQSDSLDLIWLDEECSWELFQECLARLTDRNGLLLFTFTALSGFTKLVDFLYSGDPNVQLFNLSMLDNPYISAEAKKIFLSVVDADEKDARVYGTVTTKSGLVYKEFKPRLHVVPGFDYKTRVKRNRDRFMLIGSIDCHIRTPHRYLEVLWDKEVDEAYVVAELVAPEESMNIASFSALLKQLRGDCVPELTLIDTSSMAPLISTATPGENAEQDESSSIRAEFFKAGIQTVLAAKDVGVGIQLVKQRLLPQAKTATPRLFVLDSCTEFLKEIARYSWADRSAQSTDRYGQQNTVKKTNDHLLDNLRYVVINIEGRSGKPMPSQRNFVADLYGIDLANPNTSLLGVLEH